MEHVVLSHMNCHLSTYNILSSLQYGFRQGFSCELQLIMTVHDWVTTLNNRGQVDAILLDFSKAFDKVSHRKLLIKLESYGINGKTLSWIKAFLCDRQQFVSVNGAHSDTVSVTSGVPQGSVLGPTLFLLYINDIVGSCNSSMRLFADDCIVYRTIDSHDDQRILNSDLEGLHKWADTWQMSFNSSKCKIMSVTNKRAPAHFPYNLGGDTLDHVSAHKYLGVTCNNKLQWSEHVYNVAAKANKTLGIVRRIMKPCNATVKANAYTALVRPQLEYATAAWNPYFDNSVNKLEQVQKNAARFVKSDYRRSSSSSNLVAELGWNSLEVRRLINSATAFYKFHYGLVGPEVPPEFALNVRSSRAHDICYHQVQCNLLQYTYSFFPRVIRLWNILPYNVVHADTPASFRVMAADVLPSLRTPLHLKRL